VGCRVLLGAPGSSLAFLSSITGLSLEGKSATLERGGPREKLHPRVAYAATGVATAGSTSTASSHQAAPCSNGNPSYEQVDVTRSRP